MEKINFVNGQSPYISATNLNNLQVNVENAINKNATYSNNEIEIGTWIDGKPLYRKVVNFGTLPNSSSKDIAHEIQDLKRIVKLEGFAGSSINKGGITLPHATSNPVALYAGDRDVSVLTVDDKSIYTETYICVTYTKTTD